MPREPSQAALYFDHAATTRCCSEAAKELQRLCCEDYGNPSSTHCLGTSAAQAIQEARLFFGQQFGTPPGQIVFTGSGTESDNLAVIGTALSKPALAQRSTRTPRILISEIEHPAVRQSAESLRDFGYEIDFAPVDPRGRVLSERLLEKVTAETVLVSIMTVNNIVGSVQPVTELAQAVKKKNPATLFHTDAIQAFTKVDLPSSASAVDLVSISGHKIEGPKGIGALIVLNPSLMAGGLRPVIWGGGQEGGLRSGTQSPGLISAFHFSARKALERRGTGTAAVSRIRDAFRSELETLRLLRTGSHPGKLAWNSPAEAIPHIVNLSAPHYPPKQVTRLLEKRGFIVSTGSACSSAKGSEEKVLVAMGLPPEVCQSAVRVSFSEQNSVEEARKLARALKDSLAELDQLLGSG